MVETKELQYDKDYSTKYDGVYFRYSRKKSVLCSMGWVMGG
ncbi:MAG: hypothetical protein U9Q29_02940 [Campylobacterota bacterium]|nr:hypothetical protein [Campylobacterota bacterium]